MYAYVFLSCFRTFFSVVVVVCLYMFLFFVHSVLLSLLFFVVIPNPTWKSTHNCTFLRTRSILYVLYDYSLFSTQKSSNNNHPTNSYNARAPYIMVMKNRTQAPNNNMLNNIERTATGGLCGEVKRVQSGRGTYNHIHI